jgi:hypothetical protein
MILNPRRFIFGRPALPLLLTVFAVPFVLLAAVTPYLASLPDIAMHRVNSQIAWSR